MAGFGNMHAARLGAILVWLVSLCGPTSALVEAGPAAIVLQRYTVLVHSVRCSGVVLAQDLVLTAAHCVEKPDAVTFVFGAVGSGRPPGSRVAQIVVHPDYKGKREADLALIKLRHPLSSQ